MNLTEDSSSSALRIKINAIASSLTKELGLSLSPVESITPTTVKPRENLALFIDHTLLRADATKTEIATLCTEALQWSFASVCVNLSNLEQVSSFLQHTKCKPVAVVGFPLGATIPEIKAFEAEKAVSLGAQEIDMVINIGAIKSAHWALVFSDIYQVTQAVHNIPVKVILETCLLTTEEKIAACLIGINFRINAAEVFCSSGISSLA